MDLIPYSFAPLILFRVPYTLDLLPYYLSIANGAGGVGIFEVLVFQCFNRCTIHFSVLPYWNFVCSATRRVGFVHKFICRKPAMACTNDQRLTNLYGSVVFHIQHRLVLFSGPLKPQTGSFNR